MPNEKNGDRMLKTKYTNGVSMPLKIEACLDLVNALAEDCMCIPYPYGKAREYFNWVHYLEVLIDGYNLLRTETLTLVPKEKLLDKSSQHADSSIYTYEIV